MRRRGDFAANRGAGLSVSGYGKGSRSSRARAQSAFALLLVLAALAVPSVAAADDLHGPPTKAAPTVADVGDSTAADESANQRPPVVDLKPPADDNSAELPAAETTTEATAAETTPQAPAADEASDGTPPVGADQAASTTGAAANDLEGEPSATTEQTVTIDQGASATAVAEQSGRGAGNGQANGNGGGRGNGAENGNGNAYGQGNGAGNLRDDVRVDKPGAEAGISQQNAATASADARATANVDTDRTAAVTQAADATAQATQDGIGNVQVSVRVASPGDAGTVTQVNDAGAASSADTAAAGGETSLTREDAASAIATAAQDQVTNTAVTVRVFSPGDDGPVTQLNRATAEASADDAVATATQDDVRNTYVGIRVESPGERGAIVQSSNVVATTSTGDSVTVLSEGIDTVVIADIAAPDLAFPAEATKTTVWEWVWVWSGDEADLAKQALVVNGDNWNWTFGDAPGGTVSQREAAVDILPGTWTWDWTWNREVPGWAWDWRRQAELDCASCAWVWRWDWSWTGTPDARVVAPPGEAPILTVPDQTNLVSASATAVAEATVTQVVERDIEGGGAFGGQIASVVQIADGLAEAGQVVDPANALRRGRVARDELTVTAEAVAETAVSQVIEQSGAASDGGGLDQWFGQQAEVAQQSLATAAGVQVLRGDGEDLSASADALAIAVASVDQIGAQLGLVEIGELDQWGGQLAQVVQVADSGAGVQQLDAGGRGSATAVSRAVDLSLVAQSSEQLGARGDGLGLQTVKQLAQVAQIAISTATTGYSAEQGGSMLATSASLAQNRSLVVQTGVQAMDGSSLIDVQDVTQVTLVLQEALSSSSSSGGVGGASRVVNCSTVQQAAGQAIGGSISVGVADLSAFCTPPVDAIVAAESAWDGASSASTLAVVATGRTIDTFSVDEVAWSHGTRPGSSPRASAARGPAFSPATFRIGSFTAPAPEARITRSDAVAALSQISTPRPSQARFDSRPKELSGTKTTGRESALPPVDGPPSWVAALAEALLAEGGTGIAAILVAFLLLPPVLLRAREASVVRRPRPLHRWVDVPI